MRFQTSDFGISELQNSIFSNIYICTQRIGIGVFSRPGDGSSIAQDQDQISGPGDGWLQTESPIANALFANTPETRCHIFQSRKNQIFQTHSSLFILRRDLRISAPQI